MRHSASSIGTFLGKPHKGEPGCKRFYFGRYVARWDVPQGGKAKLGTRAHSITEDYLEDGKAPPRAEQMTVVTKGSPRVYYPGRIAANIFHHLPAAGTVEHVENHFTYTYKGFELSGLKDFEHERTVGDHKFTSSLEYALTEADLVKDTQRIIYTTEYFVSHPDEREATAQWTYGTFDAKESRKVRLTVLRDDSFASMDGLLPTLEGMVNLAETHNEFLDVTPTIAKHTCNAYNEPCPFIDRCKPSAQARLVGTKIATIIGGRFMTSSALERLRAARAAKTEPAAPTEAPALEAAQAAAAGSINPPGEACEPPPDPKVVKAEAKAIEAEAKATTKALKKPKATKVVEAEAPSDVKLATLYVDCFPVKRTGVNDVELVDASELIEAAIEVVQEELNVPHYALIEFGRGRGALHVALKHIVATRPGPFNVLLSTRSSAGNDALQALSEAALVVVRGAA